ncbi:MAG: hypothetical protein FJZ47_11795 [Candidatus Tectomicrobia bacterium]|uniref:Uncharacterized protein n=1 Tax=Tectimicrobiota bacterium TaxID=2528274 RepID=A0A937W1I0_UNCTE|nr:hypothetical protein [Candidatus Tectomicrobia bacterium]
MAAEHERRTSLLPHYAFVVQWASDTQMNTGHLRGRVEHVVSRQATHFTSLDELLTFMERVLQEVRIREQEAAAETLPMPSPSSVASSDADATP